MPEKLSIGRHGGAIEPAGEPLRGLARRASGLKAAVEAARTDQVELSAGGDALRADLKRLEALAAAVEERRYLVPAEALSRRLVEEHLAAGALRRSFEGG